MTVPSLLTGLTSPQAPRSPEEARKILEALRSESLDELRDNIHDITTSQLLIMLVSGAIPLTEQEEALPPPQLQVLVTASMLAISDELDLRIPTRARK